MRRELLPLVLYIQAAKVRQELVPLPLYIQEGVMMLAPLLGVFYIQVGERRKEVPPAVSSIRKFLPSFLPVGAVYIRAEVATWAAPPVGYSRTSHYPLEA